MTGGESVNALSMVVGFQCQTFSQLMSKSEDTDVGNAGMYLEYMLAVYVHALNVWRIISLCSSVVAVIHSPSVLTTPLSVI